MRVNGQDRWGIRHGIPIAPSGLVMLDRQKIEAILSRRFPGATHPQIAAAANAIMGMDDEWEELPGHQIGDATREVDRGAELRFFRRRESST